MQQSKLFLCFLCSHPTFDYAGTPSITQSGNSTGITFVNRRPAAAKSCPYSASVRSHGRQ
jgi:hypothetical protein